MALWGAGTAAKRASTIDSARALAGTIDWERLADHLRRQRLLQLMGERLAPVDPPEPFARVAGELAAATARGAVTYELLATRVVSELGARGIRAMSIKGPVMARALYGDPGLRPAEDLDLLVRPQDLDGAGAVLTDFGYAIDGRTSWNGELPLLHHRCVHPGGMPAIELHWRIHWYEAAFASAMLKRAEPDGDGLLRAAPADELAALLLFYARDGLVGLRLPADIAQWWDTRGAHLEPGAVEQVGAEFPALRRALVVAAWQAHRLVGAPPRGVVADAPS